MKTVITDLPDDLMAKILSQAFFIFPYSKNVRLISKHYNKLCLEFRDIPCWEGFTECKEARNLIQSIWEEYNSLRITYSA